MKYVTTMSRNCMTRALSITLILGLLLSSLAFSPNLSEIFSTNVWADTDGYWSEYTNTDWYYENQNKNEYSIATAEELAGLAKLVNDGTDTFAEKTIQLTDNIDLGNHEWVPIGVDYTKPFKGNFDGDNKTISNMHIGTSEATPAEYDYTGLFGYVSAGSILNVNLGAGSHIYTIGQYAGGICAYADAQGTTITISNCSNETNIKSSQYYELESKIYYDKYAGGICAYTNATATAPKDSNGTINITNCSNIGNVVQSAGVYNSYAGGICAFANADSQKRISTNLTAIINVINCSNIGKVRSGWYSESKAGCYAGGICAKVKTSTYTNRTGFSKIFTEYFSNSSATININNCMNANEVIAHSENAGGICAEAEIQTNTEFTISNCYYKAKCLMINAERIGLDVGLAERIGNGTINDLSTALPEEQMKAAAGTTNGQGWVDITINGDSKGKMALVDALKDHVSTNSSEDLTLYNWEQSGDYYPYLIDPSSEKESQDIKFYKNPLYDSESYSEDALYNSGRV